MGPEQPDGSDGMTLSYELLYSFDVSGFLVIDTALDLGSAREGPLERDQRLRNVLDQLFAGGVERLRDLSPDPQNLNIASAPLSLGIGDIPRYHVDLAPRQLGPTDLQLPGAPFIPSPPPRPLAAATRQRRTKGSTPTVLPLVGGGDETLRLGYHVESGVMLCGGVHVLWALDDATDSADTTLTVLPASHHSTVPTPPEILSGARPLPATALPLRLKAGQLLVMAATTLRTVATAVTQSLWQADFVANWVTPTLGYRTPSPLPTAAAWLDELSPEERAIVAPRLTGQGRPVYSDGKAVYLAGDSSPAARQPANCGVHGTDSTLDEDVAEIQYEMWE